MAYMVERREYWLGFPPRGVSAAGRHRSISSSPTRVSPSSPQIHSMATTYDPTQSSPPAWILFDSKAYVDKTSRSNDSTAGELGSNGKPIKVSLWPAHPPIPSRLSVHCPNLGPDQDFVEQPRILYTADCFLLLRVVIGCRPRPSKIYLPRIITQEMSDYFIYRPAGPEGPLLKLLPNPHPGHLFRDAEVGLHPRGDHFTVAALSPSTYHDDGLLLHLFKSEDWEWSSVPILHRRFPHVTTRVITIGGEGGTIGWVDLWRGVLLCDVLRDNPKPRYVPLPRKLANKIAPFESCPFLFREIAVIGDCLKVLQLEVCEHLLPDRDPRTQGATFRIDDWGLTTYTNSKMTRSSEDWEIDCTVKASEMAITDAMRAEMLRCGLLRKQRKRGRNREAAQRNLQNLFTYQPVLGLNDEGIVYVLTRVKFRYLNAWLLAVDTRNSIVQAVAPIEAERRSDPSLTYFPSTISSYLNATMQQAEDGEPTDAPRSYTED